MKGFNSDTSWMIGWVTLFICVTLFAISTAWFIYDFETNETNKWTAADPLTYCLHQAEPAECDAIFGEAQQEQEEEEK